MGISRSLGRLVVLLSLLAVCSASRAEAFAEQSELEQQPVMQEEADTMERGAAYPMLAQQEYQLASWGEDIKASRWETGGAFAGVTALGLYSWAWGSSTSFRWNPEGWFGTDTGSGGTDKLGHAFSSYFVTNVIADRLLREGRARQRAGLSALLTTQAIMLYVEMFDGYSDDHGFAREDVVMNFLGSSLAYGRTVYPQLRDVVDYRMEYEPSGYKGFRPISDYAGQKYLFAFKLGGFETLRATPLRYLELQTGYYARGFTAAERAEGLTPSRHTFVGVGLNLSELLFGRREEQEPLLKGYGRMFFDHMQIPNTAARVNSEL